MRNSTLWKSGILSLILLGFAISLTYAQEVTITGTVVEESTSEPLIGASIVVKGTTQGTISDLDGKYSITVNKGETLVFSSIGYVIVEETVGDVTIIDVALGVSLEELEEVVVIGYGSVRKKDATGSVTSVKTEDFNRGAMTSPSDLLQGKAPGVMITNSSGDPGANSTIRIRGNSSVRAGNDPLIVVDGVPLAGGNTSANADLETLGNNSSARNPLNFINPNDIASIDILKDASATAIYGSRGANGVIIITTKQGVSGANTVEYNASFSTASISNKIKLHSADEFAALVPAQDQGGDVDALDAILQTAFSHNHNLAFRGGDDDLKYRLSLGYHNQEGIIKESGLEKYTANLNVTQEFFKDRLKINSSMIYSTVNDTYAPVSTSAGFEGSLIGNALVWNPTRAFKLGDGSWDQFSQSDTNPMALLDYFDDGAKTNRLLANLSATLTIVEGLDYKINVGVDDSNSKRSYEMSRFLNRIDILDRGFARVDNMHSNGMLLEHTLTYNKIFSDHIRFNGLLGYSYQTVDRSGSSIWGRDFEYDQVPYVNQLQSISQDNREVSSYKDPTSELQSFFGRVNMSLFDKFLLTATIRADGSSKFGTNNKYGYFPSFALAYRISDEAFIPDAFDDLKLRVGWGKTGNQEFPPGSSQAQYEITRDGLTRSQYDNPDLKWETSTSLNIGIDFSLLDRRLSGTIEYFNKNTVDLLFNAQAALPGPSGARRWTNLDANVENKGVEIGLDVLIVDAGDLTFSLGGNVSFIQNILENFDGVVETGMLHGQGISDTPSQRFVSGQPLNVFYMLEFEGLDAAGLGIYSDAKQYLQDPNPKTILGINARLAYKGWDLIANLNGAYGQYVYNNTATSVLVVGNPSKGRNTSPDYTLEGEGVDNALKASTRYLEKGDYLRLNNLTLGYTVKKAPWVFSSMRFTLTGQNLFVITDFTGFDPEVNIDKNIDDVPSYGIEYTPYPSARTFTFGLNVSF
ncbi:MAG: TonB-dependent receptor [Bacteroidales bacterium]|nr:TonB-dependent receptor [Bacteroidales bacterium]